MKRTYTITILLSLAMLAIINVSAAASIKPSADDLIREVRSLAVTPLLQIAAETRKCEHGDPFQWVANPAKASSPHTRPYRTIPAYQTPLT